MPRPITTRTHGVLDYALGVLLVLAPWLFGFAAGGTETWLPVILGLAIVVYSLVTNYERGVAHVLSMRAHLALDVAGGVLLLFSPWLFGFAELVWIPHVVFGLIEVGTAALTQRHPGRIQEPRRAPG